MRFRFVLLATTALVAAAAPARAEPISAAIGLTAAIQGLGVGAGLAGSIGGTVVGLGVSLGLSTLLQALSPKPKAGEANSGVETAVQMGGDVPRQIVVGRCAVKGQLVFQNTWGPQNTFLDRIFVLSDWLSAGGLVSLIVNGERVEPTLAASGPGWRYYTFAPYASQLYVAIWDGTQTAADPAYVAASNPAGRWSAASRLTGMTYAAVRFAYAKDVPLYENGIPDLTFEIDGARLYDLRKDDTAGGSGPHRWDDPTTWEPSGNPAVATYNYLRGFHAGNGERLLGMGVPAYDLVAETFIAAANVCDETVPLDGGGTEPRYRCASVLTCDEDVPHRQTLDTLLSTFAGYLYDYGGSYVCQAGAAQSPVRTITDADLVVGPAVTFSAKRSRAELVNRIHGQFLDPSTGYQPQSYTAQVSEADAATDGEELGRALDLMAVTSQSQAERIAKIRRREARAQASASVTLGFNHLDLQVGDWITWASARFGTRTWRVVDREVSAATRAVTLNLAETGAAVFSWSAVEEGAAPAVPVRLQPGTRISTVSAFGVDPVTTLSDDGTTAIPGLLFHWNPVVDPAVDSVEIEYRVVGTNAAAKASDPTPGDGSFQVSGVVNATAYEARATIRCTPSRPTTWTPWVQVATSGDFHVTTTLASVDGEMYALLKGDGPGSIGEAKARADELFTDLNLALSADPASRSAASSPARQVQDTIALLAEGVAFAVERLERLRGQVYEAGLEAGPGGAYRILGVDQVKADTTTRINTVSVSLDALKGQVDLLASSIVTGTVDGATFLQQLTTIQQTLDAVQGSLTSKASQATLTDLGGRVTAAEQQINAIGTIAQSTSAGILIGDLDLHAQTLADLVSYVSQLSGYLGQTVTAATQSIGSRIDEQGRAVSEISTKLVSVQANAAASYDQLIQAIAAGDSAEASARSQLATKVNDPTTGLAATAARVGLAEQAISSPGYGLAARASYLEASVFGAGSAPSLQAQVDEVRQARVDGDDTLATAIAAVSVKSNYGSASGQIGLFAVAAPSGYYAAYRMQLVANGASSGLSVLQDGSGNSAIVLDAGQLLIRDSAGNLKPFYTAVSDTFSVANLRVTNSLIAPGTLFRDDRRQLGSTLAVVNFSSGQGITAVPDSAGLTYGFSTDGPGSVAVFARLRGSTDGAGSVQLWAGVDGAYEEIGDVIPVSGSSPFSRTVAMLLRFGTAGSHAVRLAFSTAPAGVGAQVSLGLFAGSRYDVEVFLQGTAA